ncbi:MAG: tRNA preQ1(34) S-adenosylmethionine ribosyltransferase-isomerase QueA [Spirochaetia bacterium]|jgi:S-adenosylmethionine:tRNA ribosyltransferase-isomerase|nr:tRNA preQ1(34) S-adenosylmethionine ribosyltransferase-isomerase QueA [Spirochaetia bacterium]
MKTSEFYFNLPKELIAQTPADKRGESRLIVLNKKTGHIEHKMITDFSEFIDEGTLIVVNNSRVRKARIFGTSLTGGKVEFLLIKQLTSMSWEAIVSKRKKQKVGKIFIFSGELKGEITTNNENEIVITFGNEVNDNWLDKYGHIPLPPYIKREDTIQDSDRYQTVYAQNTGSVAAPTAGLHFTDQILNELRKKNIKIVSVTLHVGLGTFSPVRSEIVEDHKMHSEEYEISEDTALEINKAKKEGRKILAVGTTSVRTLESAWEDSSSDGSIIAGKSSTDIYIYPGYNFKVVNQMLTNFHTPDSSLILLVSAFAGTKRIKETYDEAIKQKYRFFSYGDAMLIL